MSTRASIASHPIHSMMIGLPIGLFVFSFFSDVMWLFTRAQPWETVAFYTLAGAIVTALMASVPGFIDYGGLRHERSRSVARWHMVLNLLAVALGAVSLWLRWAGEYSESILPILLGAATVATLGISGWLGATLVHVHGVSLPDAPNEEKVQTIDARASTAPPEPTRHGAMRAPGVDLGLHPAMRSGSSDAPQRGTEVRRDGTREVRNDRPSTR